jgi:TRAP-type mannitol/chloroaromatic compound transport system permease small subunit
VLEGSRETSGIPAVFLLKSVILVFAVQLALQAVSGIIKAADRLREQQASVA